jgi:hypothetical protein
VLDFEESFKRSRDLGAKASNAGIVASHAAFDCTLNTMKHDNTREIPIELYKCASWLQFQMSVLPWDYFFAVAIAQ